MDPRHFFFNFFFVHARLVLPINNNNKPIHCWLTFTHYAFVLDIAPVEISRHTHTGACLLDSYASRSLSFHPTFALSSKVNDPSPSTFYSCAMQIERQLIIINRTIILVGTFTIGPYSVQSWRKLAHLAHYFIVFHPGKIGSVPATVKVCSVMRSRHNGGHYCKLRWWDVARMLS